LQRATIVPRFRIAPVGLLQAIRVRNSKRNIIIIRFRRWGPWGRYTIFVRKITAARKRFPYERPAGVPPPPGAESNRPPGCLGSRCGKRLLSRTGRVHRICRIKSVGLSVFVPHCSAGQLIRRRLSVSRSSRIRVLSGRRKKHWQTPGADGPVNAVLSSRFDSESGESRSTKFESSPSQVTAQARTVGSESH
jgi:hypothetical protein